MALTFGIGNRKKEVSTNLWYSTIGHLATRWLSPFSGVARACAYEHMIFTALSKKRRGKLGRNVSFNEVMYSIELHLYHRFDNSEVRIGCF